MAKETVRYPDALVARVEEVVAEVDAFESKSEFYRFASDFLLSMLDPEHDPSVLGYGDIMADLESTTDGPLVPQDQAEEGTATGPFLDAYIQVRRHLLYDDVEAARSVVTDRYDTTDREGLLLDEVIGRARRTTAAGRDHARQPGATPPNPVRQPESTSGPAEDGRADDDADLADTGGRETDGETTGSTESPEEREPRRQRAEAVRETDGGVEPDIDTEDA